MSARKRFQGRKTAPGGGGTPVVGGGGFTDTFKIGINATDSAATPTEAAAYAMTLAQSDTAATPTEAVNLGISGTGVTDSVATPTEARSAMIRVWLSGASGTGVTDPGNANGVNDGATAQIRTAIAGPTTETLTADLGINVPSGITFSSADLTMWFRGQTPIGTSTAQIEIRALTATFTTVIAFTLSTGGGDENHLTTPLTIDLVAAGIDTLAKLQDTEFVAFTNDVAAGVTPATITLDAAAIDIMATSI